MQFFNAEQTAARLPYPALIDALRRCFQADSEVPLRHVHIMANTDEADAMLLLKPAWTSTGYGGCKLLTLTPDNSKRGLPAIDGGYILFSRKNGQILAMMDAKAITAKRTAAASALAADFLARQNAKTHLILGSGAVAAELPAAYAAVRSIERTLIWSRTAASAAKLVQQLNAQGITAESCTDIQQAVQQADIISAATLAETPLIQGKWLKAGQHIDLIGAFRPNMHEADTDAICKSDVYIDTDAAIEEAGDLITPIKSGAFQAADIKGDLFTLCRKQSQGRQNEDAITLFKSVGTALEDLAAAEVIYRQ